MCECTNREGASIMLIKRIVCDIPAESRSGFDSAQRSWRTIAAVPGLVSQFGGFTANKAHILSLWRDHDSYRAFMESAHDDVTSQNAQHRFYTAIKVDLLGEEFGMPGSSCSSIVEALPDARLLRIANCDVKPLRDEHFVQMQREIWHPAMRASGMLAGTFAHARSEPNQYLVASLWQSAATHDAYVHGALPTLRREAKPEIDLDSLSGELIELEPAWTVLAS
jgi:heme-degrading monooxygenase HmoA